MYSQIRTSMLDGICAMPVQVEVDISMGMPVFGKYVIICTLPF